MSQPLGCMYIPVMVRLALTYILSYARGIMAMLHANCHPGTSPSLRGPTLRVLCPPVGRQLGSLIRIRKLLNALKNGINVCALVRYMPIALRHNLEEGEGKQQRLCTQTVQPALILFKAPAHLSCLLCPS